MCIVINTHMYYCSSMDKPSEVILALIKSGLTEQAIADEVRKDGIYVAQSTINRIKLGEIEQPKFDLGMAILRLWEKTKNGAAA